jgi:hypothetical protein
MLSTEGWIWIQGGFGALVGLGVWLVLTGRLVPRSTLKDLRQDRDDRVAEAKAEAQVWRDAYESAKRANEALAVQLHQMLEVGHTTSSVLRSLPSPPKAPNPPGGP